MNSCGHFQFTDATPGIREIGLGVAAMQYARMGYAVLPLDRGGKKPHRMLPYDSQNPGLNGVHHASKSQLQAEGRWTIDPAANIGVATGKVSNLVVIDLDVKGEHNGTVNFTGFLNQYQLGLPPCPTAHTPSGGFHLWMRWWPGWGVPERPGILPGVDVKGDGGLVVVPPSMKMQVPLLRPGEQASDSVPIPYEWVSGCPCEAPQAPAWLGQWLESTPARPASYDDGPDGEAWDPDDVVAQGGFSRGERNDRLYRLACSRYRKHGTTPEGSLLVMAELRKVYDAGDKIGMSWHEVLTIAQSARKFIASAEARDAMLADQARAWFYR